MTKILEKDIQIAVMQWASTHKICRDYLFHPANGGSRNLLEAVNLKKQGVKAGVPDLILMYPSKLYHGLAIELKSKKGKLSANQKTFLSKLKDAQYAVAICFTAFEAIHVIHDYLSGKIVDKNNELIER